MLYHDAKLVALRSDKKTRQTLEHVGRVYGWNDRLLSSITDEDAAEMLDHIAVKGGKKAAANQTKHILQTLFKWAKQYEMKTFGADIRLSKMSAVYRPTNTGA